MPKPDATIGQFSTGPILEEILLDPQGNPYDLTGATVDYLFVKRDRSAAGVHGHVTIPSPPTSGAAQQVWQAGDTDVFGFFDYQWTITLANGQIVTVPADPDHPYRLLQIIKKLA